MAETKHTPGQAIAAAYRDQYFQNDVDTLQARIDRLEAEKAELLEATQCLVKQFEKWEGYHQWDEEDETVLERTRAAIAKAEPTTPNTQTKG